ncbi:Alpha/beta hydrolase family-domain-containing protein [Aspergillus heterothallicus]
MYISSRSRLTTSALRPPRPLIFYRAQHRTISHFRVIEHTIRCQHIRDRIGATESGQSTSLRLAVKQYIPKTNPQPRPGDVTIIGGHANGFPKELYEPLWDDLYAGLGRLGRRIRAIWVADVAHQGQSGVLNERVLGTDPSWFDHARDLLHLINLHQDEMPHPIIGIGHSMGGMQLAHLALIHPSLLTSLILIDPVIQTENPSKAYAPPSTFRRDIWPSRRLAIEAFSKNKVFQKWDPRVLDKFTEYGLRDLPTELYPDVPDGAEDCPVTLTTTKAQEVFTFLRPTYVDGKVGLEEGAWKNEMHPDDIDETYPFYRPEPPQIFRRLSELQPSVLYVFGETSELSSFDARRAKMNTSGTGVEGSGGVAKNRVKQVVLPAGHLVPMETVAECAGAAASFLDAELRRWEDEQSRYLAKLGMTTRAERISIDDKWRANIGGPVKKSKI